MLHKSAFLFLGLLWLVWVLPAAGLPQQEKKLFPVYQGGKYGFIDQTGKVVIPPQFDWGRAFPTAWPGSRSG